jgi:hypothetical protein
LVAQGAVEPGVGALEAVVPEGVARAWQQAVVLAWLLVALGRGRAQLLALVRAACVGETCLAGDREHLIGCQVLNNDGLCIVFVFMQTHCQAP